MRWLVLPTLLVTARHAVGVATALMLTVFDMCIPPHKVHCRLVQAARRGLMAGGWRRPDLPLAATFYRIRTGMVLFFMFGQLPVHGR